MSFRSGPLSTPQGIFLPQGGGAAAVTWDPASIVGAGYTLSNGNKTLTGVTAVQGGDISSGGWSSNKYYFELNLVSGGDDFEKIGIAISNADISTTVGFTADSCGWDGNSGTVKVNNSTIGTGETWNHAAAPILSCAVDFGNSTIWFRKAAGNWNNNAGADPSTNTGGFDISTMTSGTKFIICQATGGTTPVWTIRAASADFTQTVPSGFTAWGA